MIDKLSNQYPSSICILRLSALGDITHMLPVVRTLIDAYPNCSISWIIGRTEFAIVEGIKGVNFIIFDKAKGRKAYQDLKIQLRMQEFDVLLHMQASLRASLISRHIKAPVKIGFDRARAVDYQWLFSNQRISANEKAHVLDGFFDFVEALGVSKRVMQWAPPIPTDALEFANNVVPDDKKTIVINACSSARKNNFRNWRTEHYAAVANHAFRTHGAQLVLTGGPALREREIAKEITNLCAAPPIDLVGTTTIKQMLAILSKADVVIAPDTGPLHMGTAVGTPVIGLYASSNPFRTGPYNDLNNVANAYPIAVKQEWGKSVSKVAWGKRVRNPRAMDLITVSQVTRTLDKLLVPLK